MDSDEDFDLDDLDLDLDDLDLDVEEESEPDIYFSQEMSEEDRKWLDPVLKFLELDTADDDQLAEISQNIPRVYLLYKNALARTTFQYADKKRHLKGAEAEVRLKFLDSLMFEGVVCKESLSWLYDSMRRPDLWMPNWAIKALNWDKYGVVQGDVSWGPTRWQGKGNEKGDHQKWIPTKTLI